MTDAPTLDFVPTPTYRAAVFMWARTKQLAQRCYEEAFSFPRYSEAWMNLTVFADHQMTLVDWMFNTYIVPEQEKALRFRKESS